MTQSNDRPFTPVSPNPFIVGNPVRERSMFFGREAEFELVRKRFSDSEAKGGLLVFCGERRSGKTSILFQIKDGRLGPEFLPVLIDMQSMAIESELDFLGKIAEEISRELGRDGRPVPRGDFTAGSNPASAFHKFVGKAMKANPDRKLILLFDEYELFENKIDNGVLTEDTLFILSSLMENHWVFLIFTGSLSLDERRRDYWKIFLGKSIYRRISYLEFGDAKRLITNPVEGRVTYDEGVVDTIYRLTAGQPFYTQAVCQNLVDSLNEHQTNTVTADAVAEVVSGIVQNPFPQMIFLWEGLGDREKLVMSLLSEALPDENSFAEPRALVDKMHHDKYPLDLDNAAISTSLEKMFKDEILLKNENTPAGYAFRMDLWRLWVRRMHSVWQVMRELGMAIRPSRRSPLRLAAGAVVVAAILGSVGFFALRGRSPSSGATAAQAIGFLDLDVNPIGATILRNGKEWPGGLHAASVGPAEIRLLAPGYAESTFTVTVTADDTTRRTVLLSPLLGEARIETQPAGAEITVNGKAYGRSPVTVAGLAVPTLHTARAEIPNHQATSKAFNVVADSMIVIRLQLVEKEAGVFIVRTRPPGATVTVNGRQLAMKSPATARGLSVGAQHFRVELAGYLPQEATLMATEEGGEHEFILQREPPGILQLQGTKIAEFMVIDDGARQEIGTYNSGPIEVPPGKHKVVLRIKSGGRIIANVEVGSNQHVIYDYTKEQVVSRKEINP